MNNKILTITVPSYNVEKFLEKTVLSFIDPEINDKIEVLIVNDGSKDNTLQIAKELEKKYPGTVRTIDKPNGGHGSTINKGIEQATGKYFKVVDGDDWVDTNQFRQFVKALETVDEDIILTGFNEVDTEGNITSVRSITSVKPNEQTTVDLAISTLGTMYAMHSITFKTECLKGNVTISEKCFYVDQEYIILPLKFVNTLRVMDYIVYQYRLGDINQSVSVANFQKNRNMHRKVVLNVLNYYENNEWSDNINKFLETRICGLIMSQMNIYISIGNSEAKKDLRSFIDQVKSISPALYSKIDSGSLRLMEKSFGIGFFISKLKRKITKNQSI